MGDDIKEWARRKRESLSSERGEQDSLDLKMIFGGVASVVVLGGAAYYLMSTPDAPRGKMLYAEDDSEEASSSPERKTPKNKTPEKPSFNTEAYELVEELVPIDE